MAKRLKWVRGAVLCAATALAAPAFAQGAPVPVDADAVPAALDGKRRFPPEFFASYAPVSALDMVQRVPGFSIDRTDDRRGFGENAGNVLIDGERPSTKSDDVFTLLSRIPASQVDRIELTEQAGGGNDARGKGQIVNVIRKVGNKTSGTDEAVVRKSLHLGVTPYGSGSITLRRGQTTYELNANLFDENQRGTGPEDFRTGNGTLVERRTYKGVGGYTEASAGGAIKTKLGAAKLNVNAKLLWNDGEDSRTGIITNSAGAQIGTELLLTSHPVSDISWEVGGDLEFPLAPKLTTKLIGLYRTGDESTDGFLQTVRPATGTSTLESRNRNTPSEGVFRVQNDWSGIKNHAIQFGAELAYNRLDSAFSSSVITNGGPPSLSRANVLVRETRLEPFVSDVWTFAKDWKLEGGVIFEASKLRLTGDSSARSSFQFAKPRLIATWTKDKRTTVEFRAERQVSQLNFDDFATSVDLASGGQVDGGNQDLVPEKTTTLTALIRRTFGKRGSLKVQGNYHFISDTLDLIPVGLPDGNGGTFFVDGTGNIGSSRRWDLEVEYTLPFDWLTKSIGITGMEVKYVAHYHGSRVTDPVTGETRRTSFRPEWHQEWDFRHDIAKSGIAWGFTVFAVAPQRAYFVSQFREQREAIHIKAFVEYKKFSLGTLRLQVFDLTGKGFERDRFLYTGTRANGTITQIINRDRRIDPQIQLSLSGKF